MSPQNTPDPWQRFDSRPEAVRFCIRARMDRTGEPLAKASEWWEGLCAGVRRGVEADDETIAGHLRNVLLSGAKR